jgi:hypothetical protein
MHICPVDCHWCIERQCAAEGCMLCGQHVEAILSPCDHCGGLFVITARVRVCAECLRADEIAAAELLGD